MNVVIKRHVAQNGFLTLAVCDQELLGKKFEEGKLQLDLSSSYYKGELFNEEELLQFMKKAYLTHLVGKLCIAMMIKHQFLSAKDVKFISGIPHANVLQIDE